MLPEVRASLNRKGAGWYLECALNGKRMTEGGGLDHPGTGAGPCWLGESSGGNSRRRDQGKGVPGEEDHRSRYGGRKGKGGFARMDPSVVMEQGGLRGA